MNEDERKHVKNLEALHAGKVALSELHQKFADEILTFGDDPDLVAAAKDLSGATGEPRSP